MPCKIAPNAQVWLYMILPSLGLLPAFAIMLAGDGSGKKHGNPLLIKNGGLESSSEGAAMTCPLAPSAEEVIMAAGSLWPPPPPDCACEDGWDEKLKFLGRFRSHKNLTH